MINHSILSETQLQKLEPYTNHPKYGKIAQEAIEGWKIIQPRTGWFGVNLKTENSQYCVVLSDQSSGCCLIGASILNKKTTKNDIFNTFEIIFEVTEEEAGALIRGFDESLEKKWPFKVADKLIEAYNFGFEIGLIVFGKAPC